MSPLYQYTCEDCGKEFELFQMMKDRDQPTLQACTSCLNGKVTRVIANTSFRLGTQGNVGWASSGYGDNVLGNEATYKNRGF